MTDRESTLLIRLFLFAACWLATILLAVANLRFGWQAIALAVLGGVGIGALEIDAMNSVTKEGSK